jgi:protein-tyrosine-phosphatase
MIGEQSNSLSALRDTRPGSLALSYGLIRQLVDAGVRKAWSTLARQRMELIRRNPGDLVAKLQQARSVLIVCHGNIIRALELAEALNVDMSGHAATRLSEEHVENADVIFASDLLQLTAINRQFSQARAKTFLLSCLAPATPLEVRDPIDGDQRVFANCFIHILDAVYPIARTLMSPRR